MALWVPSSVASRSDRSINDRVRQGDPDRGWRGDDTMEVYEGLPCEHSPSGDCLAVVQGEDRAGKPYTAASVHRSVTPHWRDVLVDALVAGDWQQDPKARVARQVAEFDRDQRELRYRRRQRTADLAERLTGAMFDAWKPGPTVWNYRGDR